MQAGCPVPAERVGESLRPARQGNAFITIVDCKARHCPGEEPAVCETCSFPGSARLAGHGPAREGGLYRRTPLHCSALLAGLADRGHAGQVCGLRAAAGEGGRQAGPLPPRPAHRRGTANRTPVLHCCTILPKLSDNWCGTVLQVSGAVVPRHSWDPAFSLSSAVAGWRAELRSWRRVFWRLWGLCHTLPCSRCKVTTSLY